MELDDHGFLEELLSLRRDPWDSFALAAGTTTELFSNLEDYLPPTALLLPTNTTTPSFQYPVHTPQALHAFTEAYFPYAAALSAPAPEIHPSSADAPPTRPPPPSVGSADRRKKKKKPEGAPSKNLLAERRRRQRLNDRLSMLRSVVPKISKMDRTSILGDTIDYMKELLERIKKLGQEMEVGSDEAGDRVGIFNDLSRNDNLAINSPKFEVERRAGETRIEMSCTARPGLLLSTVNTMEALGLEINDCVVSCFNGFGMQASCSEDMEQRAVISCEEMKQALFRNACYGGRCL